MAVATDNLLLIEPVPIEDDLCSGVAMIEDTGLGARIVFFAHQTTYETGTKANVVKRKIVLPTEALEEIGAHALRYIASLRHRKTD